MRGEAEGEEKEKYEELIPEKFFGSNGCPCM